MLADDQHRFLADFGADIVARLLDVVRTAADQSDLRPDPHPLQLHERFAGISFGGDDVVAQLRVFRLPGRRAVRPILRIDPDHLNLSIDRTSVVKGKSVSVRVALGGRRILKKTYIKL